MSKVQTLRSPRFGKVARYLLSAATIALLIWLLHRIGWSTLLDTFARIGLGGSVVLTVLGLLENFFDAASLRVLLPVRMGIGRLLSYTSIGALTNIVVPLEGGEVLKVGLIAQHMSRENALEGLVVWNYLLKLSRPLVTVLAVGCGMLVGHQLDPEVVRLVGLAALASFLPLLAFRLALRVGVATVAAKVALLVRLVPKESSWRARAAALDANIRNMAQRRPRDFRLGLAHQILARIFSGAAFAATMQLCGMNLQVGTLAIAYAALSVAAFVSMVVPARIGVFEAAGYAVFDLLGLDPGMGVLVVVVMRIKMLVTTGLAAAFSGWGQVRTKAGGPSQRA